MTNLRKYRDEIFFPIEQQFNKFFDEFFKTDGIKKVPSYGGYPKVDIYEANDEFIIEAGVPGLTIDDIDISISSDKQRDIVKISGRKTLVQETKNVLVKELKTSFLREIALPDNVIGEPKAVLKNGVLKLSWSLAQQDNNINLRKITVNEG